MAQEVVLNDGDTAKVRSFGVGLLLTVVTFGFYYWFWYYLVNDELKDIGVSHGDEKLAGTSPGAALAAVTVGGFLFFPPLISIFNYGKRIKRAQGLAGIPLEERISPNLAFLLAFPLGIFIIPTFFHYWYVTKHQNMAVRASGTLQPASPLPAVTSTSEA